MHRSPSLPALSDIFTTKDSAVLAAAAEPIAAKWLAVAGLRGPDGNDLTMADAVVPMVDALRTGFGLPSLKDVEARLEEIDASCAPGDADTSSEIAAAAEWMFAEAGYVLGIAVALRYFGGAR